MQRCFKAAFRLGLSLISCEELTELAATLWWFTAAPKPLKIEVFWGHPAPGVAEPIYSRGQLDPDM